MVQKAESSRHQTSRSAFDHEDLYSGNLQVIIEHPRVHHAYTYTRTYMRTYMKW